MVLRFLGKINQKKNVNVLRPCLQRLKNGSGPPKKIFGPLKIKKKTHLLASKMEKMFFQKPEFCDLTEH